MPKWCEYEDKSCPHCGVDEWCELHDDDPCIKDEQHEDFSHKLGRKIIRGIDTA